MAPRSETYVVSLAVNKTCFVLVFFFSRSGRLQLLRFQTSHLYSYFLTFSRVLFISQEMVLFSVVSSSFQWCYYWFRWWYVWSINLLWDPWVSMRIVLCERNQSLTKLNSLMKRVKSSGFGPEVATEEAT